MADQRQGLAGLDGEGEVVEHAFALLVVEAHVAQLDVSAYRRHRRGAGLHHLRRGVDQGEHPLPGGQAELEPVPERGDGREPEPQQADSQQEQVPLADGQAAELGAHPARVQQRCGAQPGDGDQHRREAGEHHVVAPAEAKRALVHRRELVIQKLFLAKRLGHRDPAHRFVYVTADVGNRAARLGYHAAGEAPESERHRESRRHHDECDQRQWHVDREQVGEDQRRQDDLAHHFDGQRHDLGEGLRVGQHAADDATGRVAVEEREVVAEHGVEHGAAQAQHHVAHGAGGHCPVHGAESPIQQAQNQDGHYRHGHRAEREPGGRHLVDGARQHDGERYADQRRQQDGGRYREHGAPLGAEVAEYAAHQLTVAVAAVVSLRGQAVVARAHYGASPVAAPAGVSSVRNGGRSIS